MIGYLETLINDVNNGRLSEEEAKALFESAVSGADKECAPLLATGNTQHANRLNKLLLDLRMIIQTKYAEERITK